MRGYDAIVFERVAGYGDLQENDGDTVLAATRGSFVIFNGRSFY